MGAKNSKVVNDIKNNMSKATDTAVRKVKETYDDAKNSKVGNRLQEYYESAKNSKVANSIKNNASKAKDTAVKKVKETYDNAKNSRVMNGFKNRMQKYYDTTKNSQVDSEA